MDHIKDIARKILEKPWITQKEACFKVTDLDSLREYLPTVWFKLITTYRTRIISVKKENKEVLAYTITQMALHENLIPPIEKNLKK